MNDSLKQDRHHNQEREEKKTVDAEYRCLKGSEPK